MIESSKDQDDGGCLAVMVWCADRVGQQVGEGRGQLGERHAGCWWCISPIPTEHDDEVTLSGNRPERTRRMLDNAIEVRPNVGISIER